MTPAVVRAGITWGEVYDVLAPHDVSVVGGSLAHVGVAELVLGGGNDHPESPGFCVDGVS